MCSNRRVFIRQLSTGAIGFSILPTLTFCKGEVQEKEIPSEVNSSSLPRSTPEAQGISSDTVINLIHEIENSGIEFHSLMLVRNGYVIAEGWWYPYAADLKHQLYSLSKAFTSTGVGLAVKEDLLTVEDKVISFFPDQLPDEISENLESMKVKHLLTMSVGHETDTTGQLRDDPQGDWVKKFLSLPIANKPGSVFLYNTGATFMLSAIVQKITGEKLIDYLKPRLFEPLHIEGMDWLESPSGINTGGYGLRVKTEDIAKLGQLYLQKGKWDGKEILTEEWVNTATSKQIESSGSNPNDPPTSDWDQGYGYKFWMCRPGGYRADGAFGQYSIVNPERNLVVAITEQSFDMQASMNLIWDNLYAKVDPNSEEHIEDDSKSEELKTLLGSLEMNPPLQSKSSEMSASINGKTYQLEKNDLGAKTITFNFKDASCELVLEEENNTISIECGWNEWIVDGNKKEIAKTLFPVPVGIDIASKIAASATWEADNKLLITWQFIENVHGDSITCLFEDDTVKISFLNSVVKGSDNQDPRRSIMGTVE